MFEKFNLELYPAIYSLTILTRESLLTLKMPSQKLGLKLYFIEVIKTEGTLANNIVTSGPSKIYP